jgi:hypothetical protein
MMEATPPNPGRTWSVTRHSMTSGSSHLFAVVVSATVLTGFTEV